MSFLSIRFSDFECKGLLDLISYVESNLPLSDDHKLLIQKLSDSCRLHLEYFPLDG